MRQRMVLVCKTGDAGDAERWKTELQRLLPALEIRDWPDIGDPTEVEFVLLFRAVPGLFDGMTGLRAVFSAGAGVDGFLCDLPPGVPVARLVDPWMQTAMAAWVVHAVLHFARNMPAYATQQIRGIWRERFEEHFEPRRVGILGCGEIGRRTGSALTGLGFRVSGWTRTPRDLGGLEPLYGETGLARLLAGSEFLVCLLPLTPGTEGLLDAGRLAQLPKGAFFINASRGRVVGQRDLLAALNSGHLGGAWLDVAEPEPLPPGDPLWRHPRVRITPHVAGVTNPITGAALVAENIRRVRAGEALAHPVDRNRGY
ncbi:MAG: glyoxylate/hydroxypyruvate reductase A [Alphaproteobacteria bacterium]|nr:glyoxylate/hydroxypyruvate reductase A [Alphaproteobacteria bacterium]MCY4230566.1 glyoxylate/hydroxypyruvate reductase A [Alphaproteobacteria bacterium]